MKDFYRKTKMVTLLTSNLCNLLQVFDRRTYTVYLPPQVMNVNENSDDCKLESTKLPS